MPRGFRQRPFWWVRVLAYAVRSVALVYSLGGLR
jgi:hypothetical protein